jgi:sporadic carbohydrate cluster protein (TIGR04323 family)
MSYQSSKNNIFHGYLSPKELNGMMIPMTLQHLTLSNYCKKNNAIYSLPTGELVSQNSFFQLFSLLKKLKNKSHIIMCSMYMLPSSETKLQSFKKIITKKKIIIHCVLENFILKSENQIEEMKQLKKIVNLTDTINELKIRRLY